MAAPRGVNYQKHIQKKGNSLMTDIIKRSSSLHQKHTLKHEAYALRYVILQSVAINAMMKN